MKKFLALALALVAFLSVTSEADARLLPRFTKKKTTSSAVSSTGKVAVSARFRGDRRALIATFGNLSSASRIDYSLSYYTNKGTTQGVAGSIPANSPDPTSRELLFGTCSHGVCRYDGGISNARFTVTIRQANGKKLVKTFRLKV